MDKNLLFIILVLTIIITLLGTIALFQYLGISFNNNDENLVLMRAAYVVA
tara:strand:+ start:4226 stop:4375 length:150 start_codon:yes stop_codon:yes gene_type:complete